MCHTLPTYVDEYHVNENAHFSIPCKCEGSILKLKIDEISSYYLAMLLRELLCVTITISNFGPTYVNYANTHYLGVK